MCPCAPGAPLLFSRPPSATTSTSTRAHHPSPPPPTTSASLALGSAHTASYMRCTGAVPALRVVRPRMLGPGSWMSHTVRRATGDPPLEPCAPPLAHKCEQTGSVLSSSFAIPSPPLRQWIEREEGMCMGGGGALTHGRHLRPLTPTHFATTAPLSTPPLTRTRAPSHLSVSPPLRHWRTGVQEPKSTRQRRGRDQARFLGMPVPSVWGVYFCWWQPTCTEGVSKRRSRARLEDARGMVWRRGYGEEAAALIGHPSPCALRPKNSEARAALVARLLLLEGWHQERGVRVFRVPGVGRGKAFHNSMGWACRNARTQAVEWGLNPCAMV